MRYHRYNRYSATRVLLVSKVRYHRYNRYGSVTFCHLLLPYVTLCCLLLPSVTFCYLLVLLVSKTALNGAAWATTEVCGRKTVMGEAGTRAQLYMLRGSEGVVTSATRGVITLAGRTLAGSTSGEWIGKETPMIVTSRPDHAGQGVCFDVQLAPYSAAMLVVRAASPG